MIEKAKALVREYVDKHIDHNNANAKYSIFVIWQASVLENFKCLIATTLPAGMYFELTYDGEHGCWYFDAYQKVENRVINDDGLLKQSYP